MVLLGLSVSTSCTFGQLVPLWIWTSIQPLRVTSGRWHSVISNNTLTAGSSASAQSVPLVWQHRYVQLFKALLTLHPTPGIHYQSKSDKDPPILVCLALVMNTVPWNHYSSTDCGRIGCVAKSPDGVSFSTTNGKKYSLQLASVKITRSIKGLRTYLPRHTATSVSGKTKSCNLILVSHHALHSVTLHHFFFFFLPVYFRWNTHCKNRKVEVPFV